LLCVRIIPKNNIKSLFLFSNAREKLTELYFVNYHCWYA